MHHRRRGARLAVALTLVLTVLGLADGSSPAHADHCPPEWFFPFPPTQCHDHEFPPIWPPPIVPEPAPPAPPPLTPDQQAEADAQRVLAERVACRDLVDNYVNGNGPDDAVPAAVRLATTPTVVSPTPDPAHPTEIFAVAEERAGIALITFYPPFFEPFDHRDPRIRSMFGGAEYRTPPSPAQIRAVMVLHEVGHFTGSSDHPVDDPNAAFNREALARCFDLRPIRTEGPPDTRRPGGRVP